MKKDFEKHGKPKNPTTSNKSRREEGRIIDDLDRVWEFTDAVEGGGHIFGQKAQSSPTIDDLLESQKRLAESIRRSEDLLAEDEVEVDKVIAESPNIVRLFPR